MVLYRPVELAALIRHLSVSLTNPHGSAGQARIKSLTRCNARCDRLLKVRLQRLTLFFVDDSDPRAGNHELIDGSDRPLFLIEGDVVFNHVDGVLSAQGLEKNRVVIARLDSGPRTLPRTDWLHGDLLRVHGRQRNFEPVGFDVKQITGY